MADDDIPPIIARLAVDRSHLTEDTYIISGFQYWPKNRFRGRNHSLQIF